MVPLEAAYLPHRIQASTCQQPPTWFEALTETLTILQNVLVFLNDLEGYLMRVRVTDALLEGPNRRDCLHPAFRWTSPNGAASLRARGTPLRKNSRKISPPSGRFDT